MITGAHSIIYSKNPDADRAFFRDVLQLTKVDVFISRATRAGTDEVIL
ncbi:MAG: hypothetical protein QOE26_2719 [Verrucomicrobiota bacterium]|jgi:hypothetical protein